MTCAIGRGWNGAFDGQLLPMHHLECRHIYVCFFMVQMAQSVAKSTLSDKDSEYSSGWGPPLDTLSFMKRSMAVDQ